MVSVYFDLDFTLYNYYIYSNKAFYEIANYFTKDEKLKKCYYNTLKYIYKSKTSRYSFLFNDFLEEYNIFNDFNLKKCIDIFHTTEVNISIYKIMEKKIIECISLWYNLYIITDWKYSMQNNKIKLLNLEKYIKKENIIYTDSIWINKENELFFKTLIKKIIDKNKIKYIIDDSPYIDYVGAKENWFKTIRLINWIFKNIKTINNTDYQFNLRQFNDFNF